MLCLLDPQRDCADHFQSARLVLSIACALQAAHDRRIPLMTLSHFIISSARHYWRGHLGLLLGAFLASAILSGSLLVGDSVRASLRRVAELRLGKVVLGVLGGDRWFTEKLAQQVKHEAPNKTAIKDSADCKHNKINR